MVSHFLVSILTSLILPLSFVTGELLASAADDGMLIIWTKDDKPQTSVWGRDPKDTALDKESWRVLSAIRCVGHTLSRASRSSCLPSSVCPSV
jgi:hypothetical protein